MAEDTLMTVKELARYLKVNPWSIYTWANRGDIPAVRMMGQWRFKRREIDRWLKSHSTANKKRGDLMKRRVAP